MYKGFLIFCEFSLRVFLLGFSIHLSVFVINAKNPVGRPKKIAKIIKSESGKEYTVFKMQYADFVKASGSAVVPKEHLGILFKNHGLSQKLSALKPMLFTGMKGMSRLKVGGVFGIVASLLAERMYKMYAADGESALSNGEETLNTGTVVVGSPFEGPHYGAGACFLSSAVIVSCIGGMCYGLYNLSKKIKNRYSDKINYFFKKLNNLVY